MSNAVNVIQVEEARTERKLEEEHEHGEELEKRLQFLERRLKIACGVLLLFIVYILFLAPAGGSCADARIKQMEAEIAVLSKLWSKPEDTVLNAKFTVLDADLKRYSDEVHAMSGIYQNVTADKDRLRRIEAAMGEVHKEQRNEQDVIANVKQEVNKIQHEVIVQVNDEIKKLQTSGDAAIATVKATEQSMKGFEVDIQKNLQAGLHKIGEEAVALAAKAITPAVNDMKQDIVANEKKSAEDLQSLLKDHWTQIDASVRHLNQTLEHQSAELSKRLQAEIRAIRDDIDHKFGSSGASVSHVLAIATAAKQVGDEAHKTGQSLTAAISGVGFIKQNGESCPQGSSDCILWHWMSPQLLDPFCSMDKKADWAAGECHPAANGELEQKMFGCCRDK